MEAISLLIVVAALFIWAERQFPGRPLPASPGWYVRAILLNIAQLGVVVFAGYTWNQWLYGTSLLHIGEALPAPVQGFVCWFVGTFFFYWWHRARHASRWLWNVLHQIHHSATRIETLTSFYKHPLEISLNSVLSSTVIFVLLGATIDAAPWYSLFAAVGEFYYHSNIKTPHWTGYIIQRPEHHSVHHQLGIHHYNYGDITLWDRLFGTFKDSDTFVPQCGYLADREQKFIEMLAFRNVNKPTV